ncbi:DUF4102 domain-containing protein [Novosphingobium sp. NBM11]|uniref:tyrosine-type recombinase/integrase n=1 Tax=Novosphingobium sp. NBM11 TaxID=2596914 RepID=UPI0018925C08|nr:integrase arm-type DNA-binding domain-containing protein [Novosphingobium sp. NBM11]MBF5089484.1 DUF4102 domain-containing protein [Novosphingobium sp. NBM11]
MLTTGDRGNPAAAREIGGLFLQVYPGGGKLWRQKYRVDSREKKLSLGAYSGVGLAEARRRRESAREQLAMGKDPSREKQKEKLRGQALSACTFSIISAEYCERRRQDGYKPWAPATAKRCEYLLSLLDNTIGKLPIAEIGPANVLAAVRPIERKGNLESASRTMRLAAHAFVRPGELRHAEWAEIDPEAAVSTIAAARMKMRPMHR